MLPPATLAALQRLVVILLALIDALAVPVDGAPRPLAVRLATGAFSAYLQRLAAHLTETANQITADPAPPPRPAHARRICVCRTPPPRIFRFPFTAHADGNPIHVEIERIAPPHRHVKVVTIS